MTQFDRSITSIEANRLNAQRTGAAWFTMGEDENGRTVIRWWTRAAQA